MSKLRQQKDLIRNKFLKLRLGLSINQIAISSAMITLKLQNMNIFQNARNFLIYMPINNEVETKYILNMLLESNKKVYLPVFGKSGWSIGIYKTSDDLISGPFNILQPKKIQQAHIGDCDVAIIPAIAFSNNGFRIGYGKGVYDRLLADSKCIKIGLCYDFGIVKNFEYESNDVPMDFIISEKRIIKLI